MDLNLLLMVKLNTGQLGGLPRDLRHPQNVPSLSFASWFREPQNKGPKALLRTRRRYVLELTRCLSRKSTKSVSSTFSVGSIDLVQTSGIGAWPGSGFCSKIGVTPSNHCLRWEAAVVINFNTSGKIAENLPKSAQLSENGIC